MVVSLSSISLSILPSSSCGPMYCPGLNGDGSGSMGRGRSGSGRLGRSNEGRYGLSFLRFQGFHGPKGRLLEWETLEDDASKLLFRVKQGCR